ncbi:MAG: acetylxylan esterase [Oscillospiraceae bacterium]|nr:acetylxylan esterase [Oscillospiraceae bacterium]
MEEYIKRREEALKGKVYPQTKRADFEQFWADSVAMLRAVPLKVTRGEPTVSRHYTTWELTFNTHDDTVIYANFICPNDAKGKRPCVVRFHGGTLRRDPVVEQEIADLGVCCLDMDVRGQGGVSVDRAVYSTTFNGKLMAQGVLDKNEFYMRNIFLDAVRAVDVAAVLNEVDPERIVTYGGSQGGALSITAAALSGKVKKCFNFITSYACIHRRIDYGSAIFGGTQEYLHVYPEHTDKVMETVSYFDMNNMVSLLKVPTSFCLCLDDHICLAEFVYSVYAHAECEKELYMYPYWKHNLPPVHKYRVYDEFAKL